MLSFTTNIIIGTNYIFNIERAYKSTDIIYRTEILKYNGASQSNYKIPKRVNVLIIIIFGELKETSDNM